jgi:hypothetical protein
LTLLRSERRTSTTTSEYHDGTLANYRSLEVLLTYARSTTVAFETHSPNIDGLVGNCSGNLSVIAKGLKELAEGEAVAGASARDDERLGVFLALDPAEPGRAVGV